MDKVILIIEKSRSKYPVEKMQSAKMKTYILDSRVDTNVSARIKEINKKTKTVKCYLVGPPEFQERIKNIIKNQQNLSWDIITSFQNEDDVLKAENKKFPEALQNEQQKQKQETKTEKKIHDMAETLGVTKEEAAALSFAIDELKTLKICSKEKENETKDQLDAFIKLTATYVSSLEQAERIVKIYLESLEDS